MSKIIYLNGPSSSGKSTLARALQEALDEPFLHLGIDKMIGFMPPKINNWEGGQSELGFSWKAAKDPTGQSVYEVRAGPFAKKITRTLKDVALLFISQGYHLIIDDVAFGADEVGEWRQVLKDKCVLYVGVTTPLEVLEKREQARKDRMIGGARGQYFKVHENVSYDLEIDTYCQTLEENVAKIKQALLAKCK
jgi:chloramphenicol 3-O phosphotransferase